MNSVPLKCGDCGKAVGGEVFFTLINPEGGYESPQFLACDACMRSGRWDHWIAEHWPTWPAPGSSHVTPMHQNFCNACYYERIVFPPANVFTVCPQCGSAEVVLQPVPASKP